MPNHVTTIFTLEGISGETLAKAQAAFLDDKRLVDFNMLMPMPDCLKDFEPHSGITTRAELALGLVKEPVQNASDLSAITANLGFTNAMRDATTPARVEDIPLIVRALSNYAECGFLYWYDWCNANWGTKWGAYGQDHAWPEDATEFQFQTAWSHPKAMMVLLSKAIGDVRVSVRYADEDIGCNCGSYTLLAGEISNEDIAPHYKDMSDAEKSKWIEFAFKLTHPDDDPREYGYNENWVYDEEIAESFEAAQSA
jgi:hypothetical protein